MSVLLVVGPPGVGKTYICEQLQTSLGNYASIVPSLTVSTAEKLPTMEEAYSWAFNVIYNLPESNDFLYIFDGFPHPDWWVKNDLKWDLLQSNMEIRLRSLEAVQLILTPLSWKKWIGNSVSNYYLDRNSAENIRYKYEYYTNKTTIPGKRINQTSEALSVIEKELNVV